MLASTVIPILIVTTVSVPIQYTHVKLYHKHATESINERSKESKKSVVMCEVTLLSCCIEREVILYLLTCLKPSENSTSMY